MEENDASLTKTVSSWIVSLAISVVCCAVLFVVFAQYVVDIKKNISVENQRLELMTVQQNELLAEIKSLHKMLVVNAAPAPAPVGVPIEAPAPTETTQTVAPAAPIVAPPVSTSGADVVTPAAPAAAPALPPVNVPTVPTKP